MSKQRNTVSPSLEQRLSIALPVRYQHLGAGIVLFLSLIFFFRMVVFEGKTFLPPDSIASHSFDTAVNDAIAEDTFPLWNPYIFCGMPGFASLTFSGPRLYDISTTVADKIRSTLGYLFIDHDLGIYIIFYWVFGIGLYVLASRKLQNRAVALLCALGGTYASYMILQVTIGHMTKIAVIAWFPLVIILVENLRERFRLLDAALLALILRLMLAPAHVQYLFYIFLAIGIYFVFYLVRALIKKEVWKPIVRAAAVFAVASGLALLMGADQYFSTLEYNRYSIRGTGPITASPSDPASKDLEGGLDYTYATGWSFAPGELMTFFIPSWYGYGTVTYDGVLTQNRPTPLNLYWGRQALVDAPIYFGIIMMVFAIVGFIKNRKEPFVQYLSIVTLLAVLISFGSEFPVVYDLMYNYFPVFNKFRVPSMSLMLLQLMIPLLAGYGLMSLLRTSMTADVRKRWNYGMIGLAILLALSFVGRGILRGLFETFFPPAEAARDWQSHGYPLQVASELYSFVFSMVASDIAVACLVLLVAFGSIFLFIQNKMKFTTLAALLVLAILVDQWRIDSRPLQPQPREDKAAIFTAPDHIRFIQQDSTQFRALELINGRPPYDNTLAYWRIQSAYGYQGAKMRSFQDMVDVAGMNNPLVWQLMNIKYIITNQPDSARYLGLAFEGQERKVYVNRLVYPRAFFVSRYGVASGLEILRKIAAQSFNPRDIAYFMEDPHLTLDPALPMSSAEYVRYGTQGFTMNVKATGNNLLFLSETYYPEGWKALLDGNEIPIYRVNYLFRGVVVPAGSHTLEMHFQPKTYATGKTLSLASNLFLLAVLGFSGFKYLRGKKPERSM